MKYSALIVKKHAVRYLLFATSLVDTNYLFIADGVILSRSGTSLFRRYFMPRLASWPKHNLQWKRAWSTLITMMIVIIQCSHATGAYSTVGECQTVQVDGWLTSFTLVIVRKSLGSMVTSNLSKQKLQRRSINHLGRQCISFLCLTSAFHHDSVFVHVTQANKQFSLTLSWCRSVENNWR